MLPMRPGFRQPIIFPKAVSSQMILIITLTNSLNPRSIWKRFNWIERHHTEMLSASMDTSGRIQQWPVDSPQKEQVMWTFDVFFVIKLRDNQSSRWWFETWDAHVRLLLWWMNVKYVKLEAIILAYGRKFSYTWFTQTCHNFAYGIMFYMLLC